MSRDFDDALIVGWSSMRVLGERSSPGREPELVLRLLLEDFSQHAQTKLKRFCEIVGGENSDPHNTALQPDPFRIGWAIARYSPETMAEMSDLFVWISVDNFRLAFEALSSEDKSNFSGPFAPFASVLDWWVELIRDCATARAGLVLWKD